MRKIKITLEVQEDYIEEGICDELVFEDFYDQCVKGRAWNVEFLEEDSTEKNKGEKNDG